MSADRIATTAFAELCLNAVICQCRKGVALRSRFSKRDVGLISNKVSMLRIDDRYCLQDFCIVLVDVECPARHALSADRRAEAPTGANTAF